MEKKEMEEAEVELVFPPSATLTIGIAINGSRESKYVIKWALEKFIPKGNTVFKSLHVRARITVVPTPKEAMKFKEVSSEEEKAKELARQEKEKSEAARREAEHVKESHTAIPNVRMEEIVSATSSFASPSRCLSRTWLPSLRVHGNGSLEDRLLRKNNTHQSSIVDVGLSMMISADSCSTSTMYKDTTPVGTLRYIDPEDQRTGLISTKPTFMPLGYILQLLTAKPAIALAHVVETAIDSDNLTGNGLLKKQRN
ncbi:hypothetical protein F3Y22_tig00112988pilonHSYRG00173 [Hibiscus syriacus]|uniref:RING-type E3 ubiquitin transferase n=1 Tax=Hibiscus syriacus TaxID=106335 RepID=A0A6A2Y4A6_HIBSY|nr:hypothetical protein F3Y22_tig00112988pilonHSYRG00173 [Hibiscus syriacus]